MTRYDDDKVGNREFEDDPNAQHYERIERRFTKDLNAKKLRGPKGEEVYPKGKIGRSHREDGG